MSAEDFKAKAIGCSGNCDIYELCLTFLRYQAKSDDKPFALKAMDIFEEIMG